MSPTISIADVQATVVSYLAIEKLYKFIQSANETILHPLDEERLEMAIQSLKYANVKFDAQRLKMLLERGLQSHIVGKVMNRLRENGCIM